ncbi:MAG: aromatic ring-hydroxylating dioxygenase subunit alpha [Rhodospirillaceae bacterium]|nr:aromatic ring-hydroxylating dioxygenase subunit alpha [Rhodospirillaceae bacterium]
MTSSVETLLGSEAIAALMNPNPEKAKGLPGRAYTDPEFFKLEQTDLFPRRWMSVGVANDVPAPGDAKPVSIAGWPLVMVRGRDDRLRVFLNICPHRGMSPIAEPCKGLTNIRCPWHSWTYDLDGALIAQPNIGGVGVNKQDGFDRSALGLRELRSEIWMNTVFVNIDGKAPPLSEHVGHFERYFGEYDFSLLRHGGYHELDIPANWKLTVEGGIEDYHLPWIHSQIFTGRPNWWGRSVIEGTMIGTESCIPQADDGNLINTRSAMLPKFPNLKPEMRDMGNFVCLFPNLGITVLTDHIAVTQFMPQAADRTHYRKDYYFVGDEAGSGAAYAESRQAVSDGWKLINAQDGPLVAVLQKNHAVRDRIGIDNRFTPAWEGAVQRFQQLVIETMAD